MDIKNSNKWRKDLKVDVSDEESSKHIRFELNDNAQGGYFIGFDGRKTNYLGLSKEEKMDWQNQMEDTDIQEKLNEYIQKHQQEER